DLVGKSGQPGNIVRRKRADNALARHDPSGAHQPERGEKITHIGARSLHSRSTEARSKLPARMQGGNPSREIAPAYAFKSGRSDHGGKILLFGEFTDRFDQIAIGIRVTGNHLANTWNG